MPRIFDNIEKSLLPALQETLELSDRADFCVGYFNLRGWKELDSYIETWSGGKGHCCRLLVGMQKLPQDELRQVMRLSRADSGMDNQTAIRLKKKLAKEFRDQLMVGAPTNKDETGLRRLAAQIKAKKVIVKLFLRHSLHAKLYLLFRSDPVNPATGYLGSSNLTFSGLSRQGELNIDVLDHDACSKLARWFDDRWNDRWCIDISDGNRFYFPARAPKTIKFNIDDKDPDDQYAKLYASGVVDTINSLRLPRYGLGNYVKESHRKPPTQSEVRALNDLSRAGKRLMGFCRTNIFKRLESSGQAFILSIERHILRNYIFLHAIEQGQPLPVGTQDAGLLDARINDEDADSTSITSDLFDNENNSDENKIKEKGSLKFEKDYKNRAAEIYAKYALEYKNRFRWLREELFSKALANDLQSDGKALLEILKKCGDWDSTKDTKLEALHKMITEKHPGEKVIVFTQFADTVRYLEKHLKLKGVSSLSGVTGDSPDPTALAWRFSPESNEKRGRIKPDDELRVLIATDVLSEGQNLQDCFIVVNYDLPWAIIRLIQRAGRVDRIGQKAENILCYSFLPAEGVERIIRLRDRVRLRLQENAEVVGTDEAFFEDDCNDQAVVNLYHEKAGILDGDDDTEVDLASYAYQIWKNATDADPKLKRIIPAMPSVVYSTKELKTESTKPEGVLVYMRTGEGNDALAWIDQKGGSVTESQFEILKAAKCRPNTAAILRHENHHELVKKGVDLLIEEERHIGGQLGRPSGARFRTYERLKDYAGEVEGTLFESRKLLGAIEDIYRYPLRQSAIDTLNRQLRSGISNMALAQLVIALREEDRLCLVHEEDGEVREPKIICSLGLMGKN